MKCEKIAPKLGAMLLLQRKKWVFFKHEEDHIPKKITILKKLTYSKENINKGYGVKKKIYMMDL